MNILIVEDEDRIGDFLLRGLRAEGFSAVRVPDGETALENLSKHAFDVVLLDVMLPVISGHEVCQRMRFRKDYTPVLMLTALEATGDKIAGLQKGADDYLAKPFDFDELLARITALTRRASDWSGEKSSPESEPDAVRLDKDARCLIVEGERRNLSSKEFLIMALLMANRGRVMSRERILNSVWGIHTDPLTNTVDVHVGRLRKKLDPFGNKIVTVHGTGYRFG